VLPVLAHRGWQIEPVLLDRGTGMRELVEVRHGEQVFYCAGREELIMLLDSNGRRLDEFVQIEPEDGCE
jgi:hypothetical protein